MDLQPHSESESSDVSTDNTAAPRTPKVVFRQTRGFKSNIKLFVKSFRLLPSLGGPRVIAEPTGNHTRNDLETRARFTTTDHLVTNNYYNYISASGGVGGAGGVGRDQGIGGGGGAGHGPTLNLYTHPREEQSDFRTIRLGDINLRKEIRPYHYGVVDFQNRLSRGATVQRVYSGEIRGDPGPVTVAMYEGDRAEEDIAKYAAIRHPCIMQVYGLVRTKALRAMVFHDELIPFSQFRDQHSPVLNTYILGYCTTQFDEVIEYLLSQGIFQERPWNRGPSEYSLWIRPSTGELCLDLIHTSNTFELPERESFQVRQLENVSLDDPNAEAAIISKFNEDEYHQLCSVYPIAQNWTFYVSTELSIQLVPTIFRSIEPESISFDSDSFEPGTWIKTAEAPDVCYEPELLWEQYGGVQGDVLPNSWTRYYFGFNVVHLTSHILSRYDFCPGDSLRLLMEIYYPPGTFRFWLAQANYIFTELQALLDLRDFFCAVHVTFRLELVRECRTHFNQPRGYLFVCPPEDFRARGNSFRWPDCPTYWSLDPSGVDRLSHEAAKTLGFPEIRIESRIDANSWASSVYKGLRRFHQGKGFDPYSQDLARYLDYPLFEISSNKTAPIKYVSCLNPPEW
ncbi:hypothetical protein C8R45DRAFT_498925 [Mycena sanguinolenta]|nr:hypothetical protein C8R45DRAFT_498925 [Mycena sanguinolenta]